MLARVDDDCVASAAAAGADAPWRPSSGRAGNAVAMECAEVLGIPTATLDAWAPHRERPVFWVRYELAPREDLLGEPGMARVAPVFAALGPSEPASAAPGFVVRRWMAGSTRVSLLIRPSIGSFVHSEQTGRRTSGSGSLTISQDGPAQLATHLDAKRSERPAWMLTPGEFEVVAVEGLARPSQDALDRAVAVHPDLYETPAWVAERLAPDRAAIWTHPSGAWGIGDAALSRVFAPGSEPQLRHLRIRPARGAGWSSLGPLVSAPGCTGLDRLAERLADRGLQLTTENADAD